MQFSKSKVLGVSVNTLNGYLRIYPLYLLIILEVLAFLFFGFYATHRPPILVTPLSGIVALLILLSGLLPALIRPSMVTMLAGCLATVMAFILVTPMSNTELPDYLLQNRIIFYVPGYLIIRLSNGILLGPLTLHITSRFPRRHSISGHLLFFTYFFSLGLLSLLLFSVHVFFRIFILIVLSVWMFGLLILAASLLLKTSRDINLKYLREAQQARILFFSFIFAETPALLRPLGIFLGIEIIPFDLVLIAQILFPVSIAYSVLRHDLFGIDRALRRGIAYSILSILLLTFYFMLTAGLTALIANIWEQVRLIVAGISLFIAAVLFEPARSCLQGIVDKTLYPERIRFAREIQSAREALKQAKSKDEVVDLLTKELPPRLGIRWASLTLAPEPDVPGLQETPPIWNARLIVAGRSLGRYWLGPRQIGLSLENDEKEQLDGLVGQAALALAYTKTIDELQALNQELEQRVASKTEEVLEKQRSLAVYEERQRIARDLHDSISQSLFSINISARALKKLFAQNPQAVMQGLLDLEEAAKITLKEMRDLLIHLREVSQLSPISFPEQSWGFEKGSKTENCDLSHILNEYCRKVNQFDDNSLKTNFRVDSEIPPDILVTQWTAFHVLHIVKEAVHNAYKYSGEERVTLRLIKGTDNVSILISDDGMGFITEEASSRGLGLKGMRERISELNGTMQILSNPSSGTRIEIQIPLLEESAR